MPYTALITVLNDIYLNTENGKVSVLELLDLSAAPTIRYYRYDRPGNCV